MDVAWPRFFHQPTPQCYPPDHFRRLHRERFLHDAAMRLHPVVPTADSPSPSPSLLTSSIGSSTSSAPTSPNDLCAAGSASPPVSERVSSHAATTTTIADIESLLERPLVPTSAADWEDKKDTIEGLYMTQNLILNDVIEIMLSEHKFKAT
jgi:hypothetical protein